ncbi:MAG: peptide chain release factor-like protein [Bacillota bacterium]
MLEHATNILNLSKPLSARHADVEDLLSYPEIVADKPYYLKLLREKNNLQQTAALNHTLSSLIAEYNSCASALSDSVNSTENQFFTQELAKIERDIVQSATTLMAELTKVNEESDIVLELVADNKQSALFCADLLNMYVNFIKTVGFKSSVERTPNPDGGIKNSTITIEGNGVYALLKNESIRHTAIFATGTASVSVVAYHKQKQEDIVINSKDIRMDIFNSSGAGGQNVNKVETAVRVTHLPTGIVVTCQDERSQLQNKERALETLKTRLEENINTTYKNSVVATRKSQRSAMGKTGIRIYNFVQNTIEDARTTTRLPIASLKNGEIIMLLQALIISTK